MQSGFTILMVCTANVCRSPLAASLLQQWSLSSPWADLIEIRSAGTVAAQGAPMCSEAAMLADDIAHHHRAVQLQPGMVIDADLILTADRDSRGIVARAVPTCRPKLFTVRQAAALSEYLAGVIRGGNTIDGAPPIPDEPAQRLVWLVGELDACRGHLAGQPEQNADIADTHGPHSHSDTLESVKEAIVTLASAFEVCLNAHEGGARRDGLCTS